MKSKMSNDLKNKFDSYLKSANTRELETIWSKRSKEFIDLWNTMIMDDTHPPITDAEIDEMVLILDKKAKGSTKETYAVANTWIWQGTWRRLFKDIQKIKELKLLLNQIFTSKNTENELILIDKLFKANQERKNGLTGSSGNVLNSMLFAYSPTTHLAVVSLNHRKRIIDYYKFDNNLDFKNDSYGKKILLTNEIIINGFKEKGIETTPLILSNFIYDVLKDDWMDTDSNFDVNNEGNISDDYNNEIARFYMEKELENFLIANWDKTELAKNYDLIEENGDLVSQQYKTDIGIIDILVQEKKTKQLVVIELKKNQTSDDTIGQILRYINWLEVHKTNGQSVKGIIVSQAFDKKLFYALKNLRSFIQLYIYNITFTLDEPKYPF